jgi:polysaccharide pyruvyl transferase WcaK-like protein
MLARALGRPYVLLAQGIGPLGGWPQRRMTAHVLAHAALVSLRDPGSMALVRELGVRRPVSLVPDLAFGIEPPRGSREDRVVVAARGRGLESSRLSWLRDGVAAVAGADEVVVIPMHEPADRAASAALAEGLARARVAPAARVVDDAARTIASARLVVAMRLHALVLATLAGVPAIAVPYDIKVAAFATSVGLPVVEPGTQPVAESFRAAAELAQTASAATRTQVDALRERVRPAVEDAVAALASGGTGGSRSAIDATY